jgi:hypothetical protein
MGRGRKYGYFIGGPGAGKEKDEYRQQKPAAILTEIGKS